MEFNSYKLGHSYYSAWYGKKQKQNLNLLTLEGNESPFPFQKGWVRCAAVKGTGKKFSARQNSFLYSGGCSVWTNEHGQRPLVHCLWTLLWKVNNLMNEQFKHILNLYFNIVYIMLPFVNYSYLTACWIKFYAVRNRSSWNTCLLFGCFSSNKWITVASVKKERIICIRKCSKKYNVIQYWKGDVWIFKIGLDL